MDQLITSVNSALDRVRLEKRLTSDSSLADELGVSDLTIYRWRHGQIGKAARVLIPIILRHHLQHAGSGATWA